MPYLASAVFACGVRIAPGIGTVRIDEGWTVHADPDIVADTPVEDLGKLLLHLTCHALREHADRARRIRAEESGAWWNRCADVEINDDLSGVDAVPTGPKDLPADLDVVPHRLAEEYFTGEAALPRPWDCGSAADGVPRDGDGDGDGLSELETRLLREQTATAARDAHTQDPGSVPAGLLRWAQRVLPPVVDWRRVLAAEIRRACAATSGQVDHSYARPSRRAAVTHPVVLPRLIRPVPTVAVVADTSGSMDSRLLAQVLGEIDGLAARAGLRTGGLQVLAVDQEVQTISRVTRAAQVVLAGGGGTDMRRGIAAAAALRPRPSVIVVLTDGSTPWPTDPPPGIRVVIGLLGRATDAPSWARVVRVEDTPA